MPFTHNDVTTDGRYRIALEYCGYAEKRWVARFCGTWIGQTPTELGSIELARAFESERWAS